MTYRIREIRASKTNLATSSSNTPTPFTQTELAATIPRAQSLSRRPMPLLALTASNRLKTKVVGCRFPKTNRLRANVVGQFACSHRFSPCFLFEANLGWYPCDWPRLFPTFQICRNGNVGGSRSRSHGFQAKHFHNSRAIR